MVCAWLSVCQCVWSIRLVNDALHLFATIVFVWLVRGFLYVDVFGCFVLVVVVLGRRVANLFVWRLRGFLFVHASA